MTDQQLYLSIGIPSVLILVPWISALLSNHVEFKAVNTQLNDLRADLRILTAEVREDIRRLTDRSMDHGERIVKLETTPR